MASYPISGNTGALLGTSDTSLYTSPPGVSSMISKFTLTNTSGGAVVVNTNLSSSNVTNAESLLQIMTVPPNGTVTVQSALQHVIPPNGSVLANASDPSAIIAKLSVVQFSN